MSSVVVNRASRELLSLLAVGTISALVASVIFNVH